MSANSAKCSSLTVIGASRLLFNHLNSRFSSVYASKQEKGSIDKKNGKYSGHKSKAGTVSSTHPENARVIKISQILLKFLDFHKEL